MQRTLTFEEAPQCNLAEGYVEKHSSTPPKVAVISCEGPCLRGEICRRVANKINYEFLPDTTVRVCFQGVVTGGCAERKLVERANKVLFLEGCGLDCASRLMKAAQDIKGKMETIHTDALCDFDKTLFAFNELPDAEIQAQADKAALKVLERMS